MRKLLEWLWPSSPPGPARDNPASGPPVHRPAARSSASPAAPATSSIYLHSSRWDDLLVPRKDGRPPFKLRRHDGELWLAEETTGKLVNVGNRKLRGLGLWTVNVRGTSHHLPQVKRAELSPGSRVEIMRELDNPHDSSAVAIHVGGAAIGYVNKQMAGQLSKGLDRGLVLDAMTLSGESAGKSTGKRVRVLAADPEVLRWLRKRS